MTFKHAPFRIDNMKIAGRDYDIAIPKPNSNCWTMSLTNAIGPMMREEIKREMPKFQGFFFSIISHVFEIFGKIFNVDKAIYLNHYGFSTCLYNPQELNEINSEIAKLQSQYKDYAIIFRSIPKPFLEELNFDFKAIPSRIIWMLKDAKIEWQNRRDSLRDVKITAQYGLENKTYIGKINPIKLKKCNQLYEELYIEKYTKYNPRFSFEFFNELVEKQILNIHTIEKNDEVLAFCGTYFKNGQISSPLLGYEKSQIPLYRAIMTLQPIEAIKKNAALNLSGGAPIFKRNRGAKPLLEYYIIMDKHLPKWRRFGYWVFQKILSSFESDLVKAAIK